MSDFFEAPPPPPQPPLQRQPEWIAPRENEVGVAVPVQFVLARTDDVAVLVRDVVAYSTGFEFRLALSRRAAPAELFDPLGRHPHSRGSEDDVLRFGVQLADGTKATTVGAWPPREDVAGPRLTPRSGSGGGRTWHTDFWLWPLPPPEPLVFACEWPSERIPLTRYEIDAQPILDAAARVETLWPDDDGPSPAGATSTHVAG